jgi:uncharacterized membrane protein SirB2
MQTYALVKTVHHLAIGLSLSLFGIRWLGVLARQQWPMGAGVRLTSVGIDVVLMGAGATLWVLGGWHPWHSPWLGAKLLLLVLYVLAGSWALKRAQTQTGRVVSGLVALGIAAHMVGTALHHHPAGWWLPLLTGAGT